MNKTVRLLLVSSLWVFSQSPMAQSSQQVIVRLKGPENSASTLNAPGYKIVKSLVPSLNLYLVEIPQRATIESALVELKNNPQVKYAQKDDPVTWRSTTPNDAEFSRQWSMKNPTTSADISATEAWTHHTGGKDASGNDAVIAIVDGGMDITHPDLVENLWVNGGEIPGNGIDDDGNGYVDDVNGWNAFNNNGEIPQYATHGTHVAGIAGARGNNGTGVAGVNWDVKLMPVAGSSGQTSVISIAYGYVLAQKKLWLETNGKKGANIVATNSSFGVDYANCESSSYPVWNDLYNAMGEVGILSAAATINSDVDVDARGDVPTGCSSPYLVTVTNTTQTDEKANAGYGSHSIDLGAPGTGILSTVPFERYSTLTGTSMATPHVAGAIAFLQTAAPKGALPENPAERALAVKQTLLETTDPIPSMAGRTVSGGRLNLNRAVKKVMGLQ